MEKNLSAETTNAGETQITVTAGGEVTTDNELTRLGEEVRQLVESLEKNRLTPEEERLLGPDTLKSYGTFD